MIEHARRLQSPPASGARRQRLFVIHEAATCEVSAPAPLKISRRWTEQNLLSFTFRGQWVQLIAFSPTSTNENHVLFPL